MSTIGKSQIKNGLCSFSSATIVSGPEPGQIKVSAGSVRICSRIFYLANSQDWLSRPMEPTNRES